MVVNCDVVRTLEGSEASGGEGRRKARCRSACILAAQIRRIIDTPDQASRERGLGIMRFNLHDIEGNQIEGVCLRFLDISYFISLSIVVFNLVVTNYVL